MKVKEKFIIHFKPEEKEKADALKQKKAAEGFSIHTSFFEDSGSVRYECVRQINEADQRLTHVV